MKQKINEFATRVKGPLSFGVGVATMALLTFTVLSSASAGTVKWSVHAGVEGAQPKTCQSACFMNYQACLAGGYSSTICRNNYNICLANCGGFGGAAAAPGTTE